MRVVALELSATGRRITLHYEDVRVTPVCPVTWWSAAVSWGAALTVDQWLVSPPAIITKVSIRHGPTSVTRAKDRHALGVFR